MTALGACSHPQALSGLQIGLKDVEELVRLHSVWALGLRKQKISTSLLWRQLRIENLKK